MEKKISKLPYFYLKSHLPFQPWPYFLIFLAANTLLSYFSLSLTVKLLIGLFGLFLPFALSLWAILRKPSESKLLFPALPASFEDPPLWIWALFLFALIFSRFYHLTSYPSWITGDEGILSYLALAQKSHWQWQLLWGQIQMEPLYVWLLGIYFKTVVPSLFSLRLFCVLLSLLAAGLSYWSSRQFFSKSFSFVFSWFYSLSFLSLILSRMCVPNTLPPLFQLLVLGWLGKFHQAQKPAPKWRATVLLGLVTGLGFYTYVNWIAVAILTVGWLTWQSLENKKKFPFWCLFVLVTGLVACPMILARLSPGGTTYIQGNLDFSSLVRPDYFLALFWNGMDSVPVGPTWGGLFNSIMDALILTGFLLFLQKFGFRLGFLFSVIIFISLFPGLLTNLAVNLFRVTQVVPFLVFLASLALTSLVSQKTRYRSWLGITAILLLSGGMDIYHFAGPYTDPRLIPPYRQWRIVQYHDAYETLSSFYHKDGCLYLFSEFNLDYDNKTLNVACYPFDALQNLALSTARPQWAAVITNYQYLPYFKNHFPGLWWKILDTDRKGAEDHKPFGIFMIPTSQISPVLLKQWIKADGIYREVEFEIKNKRSNELWGSFLESQKPLDDLLPDDPYLRAVYWEKMGFFKFLDGHFIQATQAFQNGIKQGLPASQLYYYLAVCLKLENHKKESDEYLKKSASHSIQMD